MKALEFRETDKPHCFDLYEGEEKIGEIDYDPPEEEGEDPLWDVSFWSLMGTGKTWSADPRSHEEAIEYANDLYKEFVAERRELNKPGPGPRTRVISTPMGGQRRK